MSIELRVEKLESRVNNHEQRITNIENKFDFIKGTLMEIKEKLSTKRFSFKNLTIWQILMILLIVLIGIGIITGE